MVEQALVLGLALAALPLLLRPALHLALAVRRVTGAGSRRLAGPARRLLDRGAAGLARRAAAALVGLAAPATALLPQARAVPAAEAPAHARDGAAHGASGAAARMPATARAARPAVYVVRPGDCLWDIARRHLPRGATDAQVARAWPRWYSANRAVIGRDPGLLVPGMRLRVPDRRPTGTSSTHHPSSPRPRAAATSLDPDRR